MVVSEGEAEGPGGEKKRKTTLCPLFLRSDCSKLCLLTSTKWKKHYNTIVIGNAVKLD